MNLQRLCKLNDLLEDTEGKLRRYNGQDRDQVLGDMYDSLAKMTNNFAHQKDISTRAKVRLLKSIYFELTVLKTLCKIELSDLEPRTLPQDLAKSSSCTGAGSDLNPLQP